MLMWTIPECERTQWTECLLESALGTNTYRREEEAGVGRGRSIAVMQAHHALPTPEKVLESICPLEVSRVGWDDQTFSPASISGWRPPQEGAWTSAPAALERPAAEGSVLTAHQDLRQHVLHWHGVWVSHHCHHGERLMTQNKGGGKREVLEARWLESRALMGITLYWTGLQLPALWQREGGGVGVGASQCRVLVEGRCRQSHQHLCSQRRFEKPCLLWERK